MKPPGKLAPRSSPATQSWFASLLRGTYARLEDPADQYQMARSVTSPTATSRRRMRPRLLALDPLDAYFQMVLGAIAKERQELAAAVRCGPLAGAQRLLHPGSLHACRGADPARRARSASADLVHCLELDPEGQDPCTQRVRALASRVSEQLVELTDRLATIFHGMAPGPRSR